LLRTTMECESDRVTAYAARSARTASGVDQLALINKTASEVEVHLGNVFADSRRYQGWILKAPSLQAQNDVKLVEQKSVTLRQGLISIEPYSAVLLNVK
jgi:hypothetical protein